jgi:hypothetical protein
MMVVDSDELWKELHHNSLTGGPRSRTARINREKVVIAVRAILARQHERARLARMRAALCG